MVVGVNEQKCFQSPGWAECWEKRWIRAEIGRGFFLLHPPPTHCHISLLIAITWNLLCCLNIHSLLIKRGSLQVDGIKSFLFPPIAAHLLRLAHDCSRLPPAEDCVAWLWVWEHKSSAPVSYDARLWSAASRSNCQPIHHNNKRPRDSAPSAQVLHVLLRSNILAASFFFFFFTAFS